MLKKTLILFPIVLLALSLAFPQGRGGRQGQGQGPGSGQGPGPGSGQGLGTGQEQGQSQSGSKAGSGQMEQQRIKATTQQRDQMRTCDKLADNIRKQARKMSQTSTGSFNADQAVRQQNQIRDQVRTMEQEHERLMNGLDPTQQQAWQEQIRNMDQLRQRANSQLQQMEGELKGNPDAKRVTERARELEQTMNNWRNQYRVLSSQAVS